MSIGPEIYYIERTTEKGTKQNGCMYGERISYDRVRGWNIYYGADQYYAKGTISGKTKKGTRLKSTLTDAEVEGRLGFTFEKCSWKRAFFTPFGGYGYFAGTNKYRSPSPIHVKFRPRFSYYTAGFLSGFNISNCFRIGANFKAKFMVGATNKIEDDPDFDTLHQDIGESILYQVDIPLTYRFCDCNFESYEISLVPFYRTRCYGAKENYPFDFFETKFKMWGARLMFTYLF